MDGVGFSSQYFTYLYLHRTWSECDRRNQWSSTDQTEAIIKSATVTVTNRAKGALES
jgi:hypothetical protein